MRVLEIVHGYPPLAAGGTEIYAEAHARTLAERFGDEVLVLAREDDAARPEYALRREVHRGVRVARINHTFRLATSIEHAYRVAAIDERAARVIDEFGPDVAHVHHLTCLSSSIAFELAKRDIPAVLTLHDYWLLCHRGQLLDMDLRLCPGPEPDGCAGCLGPVAGLRPLVAGLAPMARFAERALPSTVALLLRGALGTALGGATSDARARAASRDRMTHMRELLATFAHVLAPSRVIGERFVQFGLRPERLTIAPYGIEVPPLVPRVTRPAGPLRLGFLGSLMVSKAPHVLLEAFRGLPRSAATLDLFGAPADYHGDTRYRQQLAPLLETPGVTQRGAVPHDRVHEAFAAIDVLVVPSVWPENSAFVVHEAHATGVPVVASRVGGLPELLEDGRSGLLVEPGNMAALRAALLRLLHEPGLLDRLRVGIPAVRAIEDDVGAARLLYQQLIAARPAAKATVQRTAITANAEVAHGPRVAAVVLNYRTPDDTLLTVRSLLASRRRLDAIFVVDNDNAPSCRAAVEPLHGPVRYILTGSNLGFSGGMNVGVRAALEEAADLVLLVNSDVHVPPSCIGRLEAVLARPESGIVAPVLVARSAPDVVVSAGIRYHPATGRMRPLGVSQRPARLERPPVGLHDAVSGALVLVRREVFERAGLLDEDFFFSFEDVEFCLRAARHGYATALAGDAVALHEGSRSIGPGSPRRLYYASRNHLLLAARLPGSGSRLAHTARTLSILALNAAHAVVSRPTSTGAGLRAVARGAADYARGRVGADASQDDR
jgi:GT2 family glycosyltransferase/glycosyltransferase involved in cell wall biosynthesis